MSTTIKNKQDILDKLGIAALNPMQIEAQTAILSSPELVLLSPTGTGKTLAFLLPILLELDQEVEEIQALILTPSRELALQIEQVAREMGTGHKIQAAYGGTSFSKDKAALKYPPALLIGTPGRIADHLRRATFSTEKIAYLVLDEFDKSLEVGFEGEMRKIITALPQVKKKILTSATNEVEIPDFVGLLAPKIIDYSEEGVKKLEIKRIIAPVADKLETLYETLCYLGNQPGIVFLNFKDSIDRVSDFLTKKGVPHGCFYGGMEQRDRERSLIKFRNGTHQVILATDLAARGLDIPDLKFIIHYHLPQRSQEFTHRNGRTARMHQEGTAYVLQWVEELLPDFIDAPAIAAIPQAKLPAAPIWKTLYLSGGRQDKISKGDIAGLFLSQSALKKEELGNIELMQDCAFVAVPATMADKLAAQFDRTKLKKKKIRVEVI